MKRVGMLVFGLVFMLAMTGFVVAEGSDEPMILRSVSEIVSVTPFDVANLGIVITDDYTRRSIGSYHSGDWYGEENMKVADSIIGPVLIEFSWEHPETTLVFKDGLGYERRVYLPKYIASEESYYPEYYWISEDGSSYYANSNHELGDVDMTYEEAMSSEHLARASEAPEQRNPEEQEPAPTGITEGITIRGRLVDQTNGIGISGAQLHSAYEFSPSTVITDSNGKFEFLVSADYDWFGSFLAACYGWSDNMGLQRDVDVWENGQLVRTYDLAIRKSRFDNEEEYMDFSGASTGDVINVGEVYAWPHADISTESDIKSDFFVQFKYKNLQGYNGPGNGNYMYDHYLTDSLPLDYDVFIQFNDEQGNRYESSVYHVPMDARCGTIKLDYFDGESDWSILNNNEPVPTDDCYDSDGGINYYVKGNVIGEGSSYEDRCSYGRGELYNESKTLLFESYCFLDKNPSGEFGYGYDYYNCPNGCEDGACVGEPIIEYPSDTMTVGISKGWNLIYGFVDPSQRISGGIAEDEIRAIYALMPNMQEYARAYPDAEWDKLNTMDDDYLLNTGMWVYSDDSGDLTYRLMSDVIPFEQREMYDGWNFVGITEDMMGYDSSGDLAGDCNILRSYFFNDVTQDWNIVPLGQRIEASSIGYTWVINVEDNCNLGDNTVSIIPAPPMLPGVSSGGSGGSSGNLNTTEGPLVIGEYELTDADSWEDCDYMETQNVAGDVCSVAHNLVYRNIGTGDETRFVLIDYTSGIEIVKEWIMSRSTGMGAGNSYEFEGGLVWFPENGYDLIYAEGSLDSAPYYYFYNQYPGVDVGLEFNASVPVITSIWGAINTYFPGESISLSLKTSDGYGNIASTDNGWNVQYYTYDVENPNDYMQEYIPSGNYNANYDDGYWNIDYWAPNSTGNYYTEIALYCSNPERFCPDGIQVEEKLYFSVVA